MTGGNLMSQVTETALRCPICGRKSVSASYCSACGAEVSAPLTERAQGGVQAPQSGGGILMAPSWQRGIVAQPRTVLRPAHHQNGGEVSGRVLIASAPVNEPADPDHWRWLAVPAWGLMLLITPVVAGIIVWRTAGLLAAAVVVIVCVAVLRFIFTNHLLTSWQFVAALRGQHIVEAVPNVTIRLRTDGDREVQLRLKGRLSGGSLVEGDRIRAAGHWRAGIFHVRRLHDARTGAVIVPIQPNSMVAALSGSTILILTVLWLHIAGVPWVLAKLDRVRQVPSRIQNAFQTR